MNNIRPLTVGFEMELEASHAIPAHATYSNSTFKNLVSALANENGLTDMGAYKYDSTINFGFEFASTPTLAKDFLTLKKHSVSQNKDSKWEKLFRVWNEKIAGGVRGENNTGMHIHLDKKSIGPLEILKLNYFISRNKKFCEMIGERAQTSYCHFNENPVKYCKINNPGYKANPEAYSFYNSTNSSHRPALFYSSTNLSHRRPLGYYIGAGGMPNDMKYRAINVGRPDTVEFRFFKATPDYKCFLKNMQFVIALLMFIRESGENVVNFKIGGETVLDFEGISRPAGNKTMQKKFCDYVYQNRGMYGNLYNFLMARELCPKPKTVQKKRKKNKNKKIVGVAKSTNKNRLSRSPLIALVNAV